MNAKRDEPIDDADALPGLSRLLRHLSRGESMFYGILIGFVIGIGYSLL